MFFFWYDTIFNYRPFFGEWHLELKIAFFKRKDGKAHFPMYFCFSLLEMSDLKIM